MAQLVRREWHSSTRRGEYCSSESEKNLKAKISPSVFLLSLGPAIFFTLHYPAHVFLSPPLSWGIKFLFYLRTVT